MTEENNGVETPETPQGENMVPQSRLSKVVQQRNDAQAESERLQEEIEALKAAQNTPAPSEPVVPGDVDVEAALSKVADNLKTSVVSDIERKSAEKTFFSSLEEGMPKPDEHDLAKFQKEKGIKSKIDAYNLMYQADILDHKLKVKLQNSKGLVPERSMDANPASGSSEYSGKTPNEIYQALKEKGLRI